MKRIIGVLMLWVQFLADGVGFGQSIVTFSESAYDVNEN